MPYLIYLKGHYDDWPTNLAISNTEEQASKIVKKLNEVAEKFLVDNAETIARIQESKFSDYNEEDYEIIDNNLRNVNWSIKMDKELGYHTLFNNIYHGKPTIRGFDFVELQNVGAEV